MQIGQLYFKTQEHSRRFDSKYLATNPVLIDTNRSLSVDHYHSKQSQWIPKTSNFLHGMSIHLYLSDFGYPLHFSNLSCQLLYCVSCSEYLQITSIITC